MTVRTVHHMSRVLLFTCNCEGICIGRCVLMSFCSPQPPLQSNAIAATIVATPWKAKQVAVDYGFPASYLNNINSSQTIMMLNVVRGSTNVSTQWLKIMESMMF